MTEDTIPPRFSILGADEKTIRSVPDARCRVFDGAELLCVASSPENARRICEAMNGTSVSGSINRSKNGSRGPACAEERV